MTSKKDVSSSLGAQTGLRRVLLRALFSRNPAEYLGCNIKFKFSAAAEELTRAIVDEQIAKSMDGLADSIGGQQ